MLESAKVFLDTNVLVYAVDAADPGKRKTARDQIEALAREHRGVISTQVLQEFYVCAVKKLGMDPLAARELVTEWQNFEVVVVETELINRAIDCSVLFRISFWDALIVASAERARCFQLLTEDLNHGQVLHGVCIENPFREGSPGKVMERASLYRVKGNES